MAARDTASMPPLAHVGHYLWVLYLVPVAIVLASIVASLLRERRSGAGEDPADEAPANSPSAD